MEPITFNDVPKALTELNEKVDRLISLREKPDDERDRFFSLDQLIEYLPENPAKATVYGWVARRQVPYTKEGKRLLFRKSEIDEWLSNGRSMQNFR